MISEKLQQANFGLKQVAIFWCSKQFLLGMLTGDGVQCCQELRVRTTLRRLCTFLDCFQWFFFPPTNFVLFRQRNWTFLGNFLFFLVENRLNVLLFLKNSPIYLDNEKEKIERKTLIASLSPPPKKRSLECSHFST